MVESPTKRPLESVVEDVFNELTCLLRDLKICDYTISGADRELVLRYKEDFDAFYPKLNADPQVNDPRQQGAPFAFGQTAFFEYKGWSIKGYIRAKKPTNSFKNP